MTVCLPVGWPANCQFQPTADHPPSCTGAPASGVFPLLLQVSRRHRRQQSERSRSDLAPLIPAWKAREEEGERSICWISLSKDEIINWEPRPWRGESRTYIRYITGSVLQRCQVWQTTDSTGPDLEPRAPTPIFGITVDIIVCSSSSRDLLIGSVSTVNGDQSGGQHTHPNPSTSALPPRETPWLSHTHTHTHIARTLGSPYLCCACACACHTHLGRSP